jgi:two-component system chemotaxis response regulator CheB
MNGELKPIKAMFIGTSAGGVVALNTIFKSLHANFLTPIIVVLHLGDNQLITSAFHGPRGVMVKEAEEKESIKPKHIYFAPAGYHLLVEDDQTFSLTTEDKVQFARPSIDVTMDSLASVYEDSLLGIVLTGANEDGADGLLKVKELGGVTVVQDPKEAEYEIMPSGALKKVTPDFILSLKDIGALMTKLEGRYYE